MQVKTNNHKAQLDALYESVLEALTHRVNSEDVEAKDIDLAMKFLRDNGIRYDLSQNKEDVRAKLAVIPRLSPEELQLG